MKALGLAILVGLTVSCGPTRYPAPQVKDIGAEPASDSSAPGAASVRSEGSAVTSEGRSFDAPFSFLEDFVHVIARSIDLDRPTVVVLPAFSLNKFFNRYEVTQLGEQSAAFLVPRLRQKLGPTFRVLTPEMFERAIQATNRSLADVESPEEAVELANRAGIAYVVRGLVTDTPTEFTLEYECVDGSFSRLARVQKTLQASDPSSSRYYRLFKDASGQPVLSAFRIGALAEPVQLSLRKEVQWIVASAVERLLSEAGSSLSALPIAVLPTKLPSEFRFYNYQRALRREILREKKRLMGLGFDENRALSEGPVRILGQTYANLRSAEDRANELVLERDISNPGQLSSTIGRIIFEELEDRGEKSNIQVIPHEDLINQTVAFSREELEKIGEGILAAETKQQFRTRGAKALLINELLESGDSYELVFQLRQLEDLQRLTGKQVGTIEPRFAYELRNFLK